MTCENSLLHLATLSSSTGNVSQKWELFMALMAFAYNSSFHRTIKTSPFTLTYGMEPRTIELNARTQFWGESQYGALSKNAI
jgi:hypothetical protein